jgi:general secretion pathway protein C
VQRAISNEPGLISDVLRPQPVFADGKLRGYRVYPGQNARAFAALGLRNGDLVLSVNGTALDDPNRGNDIFASLGNSDQARVTVMRNGQQQDITLNMSQIANQAEQMSSGSADPGAPGGPPADSSAAPPPEPTPGAPIGQQRPLRDVQ